ncbi:MAG: serine/threonine protein kinase [Polyangiaceae bacterium]|jgi:serine/threonine-protein kinase|nr:serine/threonine protein kinase [Polyangiaceae bacterium]
MTGDPPTIAPPQLIVGRYAIYHEIASGGMATVHLGRLLGPVGFSRTVAIKRLHGQFAKDPDFVSMFVDEALVTARVRHPNVVPTLDVVSIEGELFLVMEYIPGENLARCLSRYYRPRDERMPLPIALGILIGALHGLHAAHLAKNERGEPLGIVHRDVSPQNILIGTDGMARLLDFGVAKAVGRMHNTQSGNIKGKLCYMAPEQLEGREVNHLADIFAAGTVLWELLTGERLLKAASEMEVFYKLLRRPIPPPSDHVEGLPPGLDEVALRALARNPADRFPSALAMADALESLGPIASSREIGSWVGYVARDALEARQQLLETLESLPSHSLPVHPRAGPDSSGRTPALPRTLDALSHPSSPPTLTSQIAVVHAASLLSGPHDALSPASQSQLAASSSQQLPTAPIGVSKRLFFFGLAGAAALATFASSWMLARQAPGGSGGPVTSPVHPNAPIITEPEALGAPALPSLAGAASSLPSGRPPPPNLVRPPGLRPLTPRPPRPSASAAPPAVPSPSPPPREPTTPDADDKYRRD